MKDKHYNPTRREFIRLLLYSAGAAALGCSKRLEEDETRKEPESPYNSAKKAESPSIDQQDKPAEQVEQEDESGIWSKERVTAERNATRCCYCAKRQYA